MPDELMPASSTASGHGRHIDLRLGHGNLVDIATPAYVLGVFDNINPTGATRYVDNMLGGTLMRLVQDGMLGSRLGEVSMLPTPRQRLLADMVVFVGLGPIDSFGPRVLEIVAENLARVVCAAKLTSFTVVPLGSNAGLAPRGVDPELPVRVPARAVAQRSGTRVPDAAVLRARSQRAMKSSSATWAR